MVSAVKQWSYLLAYMESIPDPIHSFLIPWKAKRQMEQGNEVEPRYTARGLKTT